MFLERLLTQGGPGPPPPRGFGLGRAPRSRAFILPVVQVWWEPETTVYTACVSSPADGYQGPSRQALVAKQTAR